MKRKTSTNPSRIYTYGCLPTTEGADLVNEQFLLAHRYQNKLVEIERQRRASYRGLMAAYDTVSPLVAKLAGITEERDALRTAIKVARATARARTIVPDSTRARVQELLVAAKALRAEIREAKRVAAEDSLVAAELAVIEARAQEAQKAARAESGVYWGTYLLVERANDQARKSPTDPRFRRFDGRGRVGVQFQRTSTPDGVDVLGIPVAIMFGDDTRMRIGAVPAEAWARRRGGPEHLTRTVVRIRIGTKDRQPVWAAFPMILHRPLPADGVVKLAWIRRYNVSPYRYETRPDHRAKPYRYELQVSVEAASFIPIGCAGKGTAAIDIGWRTFHADGIRVAMIVDDQGREQEVRLPAVILERLAHTDSIRATRDQEFNSIKLRLLAWLLAQPDSVEPTWHREQLQYLPQWRSPARLATAVWDWREHRVGGDEEIYPALEEWRKHERHLYQWEANKRVSALGHRKEVYRQLAHELSTRYATIVIEKFDLRRTARLAAPEEDPNAPKASRHNRQSVALSELRNSLVQACRSRGVEVVEVNAKDSTMTCAACGALDKFDAAVNLIHACSHCGEVWDQDVNAARNILARASGGVVSAPPEALAKEVTDGETGA